jgi:predicted alpha/beta hydrolase
MNAALDYMVNERGHTSITWLGHSVGGQLVPLLHQKQHIKKVIALNAALGYWGYFPFPKNLQVWALWHIVQPLMIRWYGYGNMKKIGWGENLPANILVEWKEWCINRNFYQEYFRSSGQHNRLDDFRVPLTAVYTSDDYIANDKTVPLMLQFFPNSPKKIRKLAVEQYTREKVGHIGIFRKKFENTLWPVLVDIIDN